MEKITADQVDDILESKEYVILDFSSPGCAPCQKVPPLLESIIEGLKDYQIAAFEVNVAEEPTLAQRYFVLGVPTIIIFHGGREIKRFNAIPKKEKIIETIQSG